jgi:hypothetical protein
MFSETGRMPGIDGEEVPAETIVPDVKEYISETIDDPEAIYDPKIWDVSGFALVLSWLAQKWNQRCLKLAPRGSKNPEQYLTKEQQKACLDSAAAELIREITQGRSLNQFFSFDFKMISKRFCPLSRRKQEFESFPRERQ